MCDPTIVVPGIMGSELYYNGSLCWPPVEEPRGDEKISIAAVTKLLAEANVKLARLARKGITESGKIIPGCCFPLFFDGCGQRFASPEDKLLQSNISEQYVQSKKAGAYDTYLDACEYFHRRNGKIDIYFFGYDWRIDCNDNAGRLEAFIESVKKLSGCEAVNIVAHSMGCIIVGKYLKRCGGSTVRGVATVGGPFLGSEYVKLFLNKCLDVEQFLKSSPIGDGLDIITSTSPLISASVLPAIYRVAGRCKSLKNMLPSECAEFAEEAAWDGLNHYNFAGTGTETLEICSRDIGGAASSDDRYGDGDGQVLVSSATAGGRFENTKFYNMEHNELIFKEKCLQDIYDSLYN